MDDADVVVLGNKVLLRQKRVEDAEDDYWWRVDEELAALDATGPLRMAYPEFVRMYQSELRHPSLWMRRYAIDTFDERHIGNCMFYDIDMVAGEGELGIMLGNRDYWSKGYGLDAMAHLVEECFKSPTMKKLYLHTLEWNARARRAFAKCGFREVRPVRRAGRDFIRMEITREEWEEVRSKLVNLDGRRPEA